MAAGFAATPEMIVRKAISLLEFTPNSVVYDVGCGDGRFAIECVQIYPVLKCLLIEKDPVYKNLAQQNCKNIDYNNFIFLENAEAINYSEATHIFYTLRDEVLIEQKIIDEIRPKTKVVTLGYPFKQLNLIHKEDVTIQGSVYDLSISIRNFEDIKKLYPLTVKELIENFPSRLQYFWAGPFWNTVFIYEK